MRIFVRTLENKLLKVEVKPSENIESVKARIQSEEDIQRIPQRLMFGNTQLENGRTVSDYDIQRSSTLHFEKIVRIFVETATGKEATPLLVGDSDTVKNVKIEIQFKEGIPSEQQRLIFKGRRLRDEDTLKELKIQVDDRLYLAVLIQIFIRYRGKTTTLRVDARGTVENVKDEIQDEEDLPFDQQRLIFAGKQLFDHHKLSHYGIEEGSTLDMVRFA